MGDFFTLALVTATLRMTTPLLFAALGGVLSERSGVINIALEGMMLTGAFFSVAGTWWTGNPWLGMLIGVLSAFASTRYRASAEPAMVVLAAAGAVSLLDLAFARLARRTTTAAETPPAEPPAPAGEPALTR